MPPQGYRYDDDHDSIDAVEMLVTTENEIARKTPAKARYASILRKGRRAQKTVVYDSDDDDGIVDLSGDGGWRHTRTTIPTTTHISRRDDVGDGSGKVNTILLKHQPLSDAEEEEEVQATQVHVRRTQRAAQLRLARRNTLAQDAEEEDIQFRLQRRRQQERQQQYLEEQRQIREEMEKERIEEQRRKDEREALMKQREEEEQQKQQEAYERWEKKQQQLEEERRLRDIHHRKLAEEKRQREQEEIRLQKLKEEKEQELLRKQHEEEAERRRVELQMRIQEEKSRAKLAEQEKERQRKIQQAKEEEERLEKLQEQMLKALKEEEEKLEADKSHQKLKKVTKRVVIQQHQDELHEQFYSSQPRLFPIRENDPLSAPPSVYPSTQRNNSSRVSSAGNSVNSRSSSSYHCQHDVYFDLGLELDVFTSACTSPSPGSIAASPSTVGGGGVGESRKQEPTTSSSKGNYSFNNNVNRVFYC